MDQETQTKQSLKQKQQQQHNDNNDNNNNSNNNTQSEQGLESRLLIVKKKSVFHLTAGYRCNIFKPIRSYTNSPLNRKRTYFSVSNNQGNSKSFNFYLRQQEIRNYLMYW